MPALTEDRPLITTERVYNEIRHMICNGDLEPGERLLHRQLAARFGTSNGPVIQAIRRLERDGLVVCHTNFGAHVRTWTEREIVVTCMARGALEGLACRLFVTSATPTERFQLGEYVRECEEMVSAGNIHEGIELHMKLHMYIFKCARSPVLYQTAASTCVIGITIGRVLLSGILASEFHLPAIGAHEKLLSALDSGDPDLAEQVGREHVFGGHAAMQALIERHGLCKLAHASYNKRAELGSEVEPRKEVDKKEATRI